MYANHDAKNLSVVQSTFDRLVVAAPDDREVAFSDFARAILGHFDHSSDQDSASSLFSNELPFHIQRFAAGWLLRVLSHSVVPLDFRDTERRTASLFDRVLQNDVYPNLKIDPGTQTYEKLQALAAFARGFVDSATALLSVDPDLDHLPGFRQQFQQLLNDKQNQPFIGPLLPHPLVGRERVAGLFRAIENYTSDVSADLLVRRDEAFSVCDDFLQEALNYGTTDAKALLGGLAANLKSAVASHFDSLEANETPALTFIPIAKKYPMEQLGAAIVYRVRIRNEGIGTARDLRLEEVVSDESIALNTGPTSLGVIQPGSYMDLEIIGKVVGPCAEAKLTTLFSWARPGSRSEVLLDFVVDGQRTDVDWERVESTEPYSLEAITTEEELIGRRAELRGLLQRANQQTVGSAYIYGQKRVGKTSLANAVAESLESDEETKWIVITKGSGDYVSDSATSTIKALGELLVSELRARLSGIDEIPVPDFSSGLAPLSPFIDAVLRSHQVRILFILDEFDELPIELFQRTNVSASLFQPLRQISNKVGCGFILVGGESMQQIVNGQGDRLNRFRATRVDYFDKSNDWNDFSDLVRLPVQDWLTISDEALNLLFSFSAGNPFFAKLLAGQLADNMAGLRHCDASEADMSVAIDNALMTIGANSFAHFWADGIVHEPENAEHIRLVRRAVLIAVGQSFRRHVASNYDTISAEFAHAVGTNIGPASCQTAFQDFLRRDILQEDQHKEVTAKIPLFQSWLTSRGVGDLLADFRENDYLVNRLKDDESQRISDEEVLAVCTQLGRYQGRAMEPIRVRQWLDQFGTLRDQRLMYDLLLKVRVYDEDLVRYKMGEAFGIVRRNLRTVVSSNSRYRSDIFVSYLDHSIAKSGPTYCRLFASENRIRSTLVQPLEAMESSLEEPHSIQRLVIIDDFCGTGGTIIQGIRDALGLLKRANEAGIRIIIIVLAGFSTARDAINDYIDGEGLDAHVYFCDELGDEHKAFSETSLIFPDPEGRERAREIAESKGVQLVRQMPLGFRNTQGTIVFYQSCPNNTLPIFWSVNNGWPALFPR